jgi:hypothetical protein
MPLTLIPCENCKHMIKYQVFVSKQKSTSNKPRFDLSICQSCPIVASHNNMHTSIEQAVLCADLCYKNSVIYYLTGSEHRRKTGRVK